MGLFKKLLGTKKFEGQKPVEWEGPVIEFPLTTRDHPSRGEWLREQRRKMVWVAMKPETTRSGATKLVFHVGGYVLGELSAARVAKSAALADVLRAGVNVAIVSVSQHDEDSVIFGREFRYRPRPPWA